MIKFGSIEIPYDGGNDKNFGTGRIEDDLNEWAKEYPEAEYLGHTTTVVAEGRGAAPGRILVVIAYRDLVTS